MKVVAVNTTHGFKRACKTMAATITRHWVDERPSAAIWDEESHAGILHVTTLALHPLTWQAPTQYCFYEKDKRRHSPQNGIRIKEKCRAEQAGWEG